MGLRITMQVKYLSTKMLKEILDDAPYFRGNGGEGKDYTDYADEIEATYYERLEQQARKSMNKDIEEYNYWLQHR